MVVPPHDDHTPPIPHPFRLATTPVPQTFPDDIPTASLMVITLPLATSRLPCPPPFTSPTPPLLPYAMVTSISFLPDPNQRASMARMVVQRMASCKLLLPTSLPYVLTTLETSITSLDCKLLRIYSTKQGIACKGKVGQSQQGGWGGGVGEDDGVYMDWMFQQLAQQAHSPLDDMTACPLGSSFVSEASSLLEPLY